MRDVPSTLCLLDCSRTQHRKLTDEEVFAAMASKISVTYNSLGGGLLSAERNRNLQSLTPSLAPLSLCTAVSCGESCFSSDT